VADAVTRECGALPHTPPKKLFGKSFFGIFKNFNNDMFCQNLLRFCAVVDAAGLCPEPRSKTFLKKGF
jgi:hypothetical protein